MSLLSQYSDAQDVAFIDRVQQAICSAAVNIQAELSSTTNHTNRSNYAKLVLNAPSSYAPLFAQAAVSDGVTDKNVSDGNLATRISAIWNAMAGVV